MKRTKKEIGIAVGIVTLLIVSAAIVGCEMEEEITLQDDQSLQGITGEYEETGYEEWRGVIGIANMMYMCTATLIDPQVVLTAAHCVEDNLRVYGGANMDELVTTVVESETHESPMMNDVAVLKLEEPITDRECYGVKEATPVVGEEGWVVGYGQTSADDWASAEVHRKGIANVKTILERELETGGEAGTCLGDSGGPFFLKEGDTWVVAGITSYGTTEECLPDQGNWDMNTAYYREWIDEMVQQFTGHGLDETGCTGDPGGDNDLDGDSDSDTDTDTDGDSDSDTDGDTDGDSDSDSDTDTESDTGDDSGGLEEESEDDGSDEDCGCSEVGSISFGIVNLLLE